MKLKWNECNYKHPWQKLNLPIQLSQGFNLSNLYARVWIGNNEF
jgi:hypothetical protein